MKKNKKQTIILSAIIIVAIIIDQIAKIIVINKGLNIVETTNVENNNGYYILVTVLILIMIIRYITNDNTFIKMNTKIILSFAIAGAIGNLIDRIWNQNVIVFIKIANGLNLNLAYCYIIVAWVGLAAILTKNITKILKDRKKEKVIKDEYQKNKNK